MIIKNWFVLNPVYDDVLKRLTWYSPARVMQGMTKNKKLKKHMTLRNLFINIKLCLKIKFQFCFK